MPVNYNAGSTPEGQRRNHQLLAAFGLLASRQPNPQDGDSLVFNGATGLWEAGTPATSGGSTYAQRVQSIPDLEAYYRLGESSGTSIADSSGNSLTGTSSGSPTLGADGAILLDSDTAIDFDGSDDFISLGDPAALAFSDVTPWAVSVWFRRPAEAGAVFNLIIGKRDESVAAAVGTAWAIGLNDSTQRVTVRVGGYSAQTTATATPLLDDNIWHHLCIVWNPALARLLDIWIDGVVVAYTASGAATTVVTTAPVLIGAYGNAGAETALFTGRLDELAIFSRAIEPNEIRALSIPFGT